MAKTKKRKIKRKTARGNFRKVSPAAAKRYINYWVKRGGPDAPKSKVQEIRYREALAVMRDFEAKKDAHKASLSNYDAAMKTWKAMDKKKVFEHAGLKARFLRPAKPRVPSEKTPTGGNFRQVTKTQAKNYLRNLCVKSADGPAAIDSSRPIAAEVDGGVARAARIQEAVTILGPEVVTSIVTKCELARKKVQEAKLKAQAAAEARKKTVNKNKLAKLEKAITKCETTIDNAKKAIADIEALTPAPYVRPFERGDSSYRRRTRRARR